MEGGLTGLVSTGFQAYGAHEGGKFRGVNPELARAVYGCWVIGPDAAKSIATPLAASLAEYLPESWLTVVAGGLNPLQAVGAFASVLAQCQEGQKQIIQRYEALVAQINSHGPMSREQGLDGLGMDGHRADIPVTPNPMEDGPTELYGMDDPRGKDAGDLQG